MAGKTVTLYIDDNNLRLMVTQGRQIREWAESPLEPGLIENNVVINQAEVVVRIQQLLGVRRVNTRKIILGVSGLHCLTRPIILPRLPKEMMDEAVRREAQRALPVPLEELYISWQIIPGPEDRTQVFIVGIPRKAADSLLTTLQKAGLKTSFMEIKPLLLAGVNKETTAVIVDVQATEFDIVISVNGVPQPVRSISFPDGALSGEEKLTTIRDELNRTISFYNSNNPENKLDSSVPVFASGELINEPELCQTLSSEIGQPVLPLPSPLECPEGLDLGLYMINICLAFQRLSSRNEAGTAVISLNSLPVPYQPKPISVTNILAVPGAILAAASIVFLVMFIQSTSSNIASLSTRLNTTNQFLQQKQSQQQEIMTIISGLENEISEKGIALDNFTAALGALEGQTTGVNSDLTLAIDSLPASINLENVSHITSILTVKGESPGESQILAYIRKLDSSGRFGDVTIIDMTRTEGGEIDFTLLGTIRAQSLGVRSIDLVLGSLPAGINLTEVNSDAGTLTVNGLALDEDKIFLYLRTLDASQEFQEITISSMTRTDEGEIDFSLILRARE
ncbi:MAG: PilN domain-containing protein [Dehalococcoidales bacterium]